MTEFNATSYAAACKQATTDQGLDPIVAALADAGVSHFVEQTGGFVMCVAVSPTLDVREFEGVEYTDYYQHPYIFVTSAREWNGGEGWMVVRYRGDDGEVDEGSVVGENLDTATTVRVCAAFNAGDDPADALTRDDEPGVPVFTLTFACDNAAFDQWDEVARVLRAIADAVEETAVEDIQPGTVRDANGNTIGSYEVTR